MNKKKIVLFVWSIWQFVLALSCRPIQDDYGYLSSGANRGFSTYLSDFWSSWGGNLAPSIIRIPFYLPSISGRSWVGLALFSLITGGFVFFSSIVISTWLTGRKLRENNLQDFVLAFLTCLGFEGIFSPGVLAAFVFGPASSTHLLPICSLVMGLWLCTITLESRASKVFVTVLIIFTGYISGNSNVAESLAALSVSLILVVLFWIKQRLFFKLGFLDLWRVIVLNGSIILGFVLIVVSPGFRNRANSGSGLPGGITELFTRFRSSFVSFTAEIFTHPMWMVVFLLAIIAFKSNRDLVIVRERAAGLLLLTISVYGSLIIGTTFAYAAWHQSVGLLFLLTPAGIALAFFVSELEKISKKIVSFSRPILVTLIIVIVVLSGRVTVLEVKQGQDWDNNLSKNYCALVKDSKSQLDGAEIKYPPIGLGIEDVNSWQWMRDDYSKWVLSPKFTRGIRCGVTP